jgi:hypothetical protein
MPPPLITPDVPVHCPKCGQVMEVIDGELACRLGNMGLSKSAEGKLKEIAASEPDANPSRSGVNCLRELDAALERSGQLVAMAAKRRTIADEAAVRVFLMKMNGSAPEYHRALKKRSKTTKVVRKHREALYAESVEKSAIR